MALIRAAQPQRSFLSHSPQHGVVIHTQDEALVQQWEIEHSPEDGYVYLRSSKNRKLMLISPNKRENQIEFGELTKENSDRAKWRIETVAHRYLDHDDADNFPNHVFLMARIIPLLTGAGSNMIEHEMGVNREKTDNNAPVVLWQHKGLACTQPLNQMWIIE
jgi:hypothetical protein